MKKIIKSSIPLCLLFVLSCSSVKDKNGLVRKNISPDGISYNQQTDKVSLPMNQFTNFNTTKVFRSNLLFPQAVIMGDLIFLSGTVGTDVRTGKLVGDSFEEQAIQAFKNVKTILEEAGSGMDKVVKTTIYMVSGCDSDFKIINKVYGDFFPNNPPARSAPQVMPFPGGILISVECIAHS